MSLPAPATTPPTTTVYNVARQMAAERSSYTLVTSHSALLGIATAKDLCFRVIGNRLSPATPISHVMTSAPVTAAAGTPPSEALTLMVLANIRHLPLTSLSGAVVGVVDITRCFHQAMVRLERMALGRARLAYALLDANSVTDRRFVADFERLVKVMESPLLLSVVAGNPRCRPLMVAPATTIGECVARMEEHDTTAVLVEDGGVLIGIATSKDVVLRALATGMDPAVTLVARVMTPRVQLAHHATGIHSALRMMYEGHYLNLPVMDDEGRVVGVVGVLQLTYAAITQLQERGRRSSEGSATPALDRLWGSMDKSFGRLDEPRLRQSSVSGGEPRLRQSSVGVAEVVKDGDVLLEEEPETAVVENSGWGVGYAGMFAFGVLVGVMVARWGASIPRVLWK